MVADSKQGRSTTTAEPPLPPELEARIAAFDRTAPPADFDARSWFWMILFGVAIPLALLGIGWWA